MTDSRGDRPTTSDQTTDTTDPSDAGDTTVIASVEEVDAEVRAKLTGQGVATIAEQAEAAFATIDVRLTGEQLAAYADAVNTGSAFDVTAATTPDPGSRDRSGA